MNVNGERSEYADERPTFVPVHLCVVYRQSVTCSGPTVCHLTLGLNETDPGAPLAVSHTPALEDAAHSALLANDLFVCFRILFAI